MSAGIAGLTGLRAGWQPVRGETLGHCQRLDAQRNSQAPRRGDAPDAGETTDTSTHCMLAVCGYH